MDAVIRKVFFGRHGFQLWIGLPLIAAIFLGWPVLLHWMGQDTATFGLGMFEVPLVSLMYVIFNSAAAYPGALLLEKRFQWDSTGRSKLFLLFLLYFCALSLLEAILLLGGRAPA